ncbi:phosphonate ABC transporter, permease protein PhnE [Halorubrum vacuolatum]|uniref:Phosphonate transport system permease protein n=1 Tax=Halorubrum vacuolatum TaxID=63740 RepID=A0A238VZ90_HALVU|nr:phosphonate ABC transporter, permease protein PhnE [Halorubrum vacuolatum]SNR39548.1 phosphonate transport system permease protein [Halorubrum vacuolatum]
MSESEHHATAATIRATLGTFGRPLIFGLALLLAIWSIWVLELHGTDFSGGAEGLSFLYGAAIPPEMSVLEVGLRGLLETLYIAYVGTLFGVVLSLPVSLVASRNLFPWYLTLPARWLLAVLRVLPSILWAVIFVILIGTGPAAGVFAITLYTIGFVGKLEYEAFEGLDSAPIEAVSALGATRLQVLRFVVLPQAINSLISQSMFMFEYNVRHAAAIGIVGAGGIGYYIMGYLDFLQYDRVIVLLAIVFLAVLIIDELSYRLRALFLGDTRTSLSS